MQSKFDAGKRTAEKKKNKKLEAAFYKLEFLIILNIEHPNEMKIGRNWDSLHQAREVEHGKLTLNKSKNRNENFEFKSIQFNFSSNRRTPYKLRILKNK